MGQSELLKTRAHVAENAEEPPGCRKHNEKEYLAVFEAIRSCRGRVATMGMGTSSVAARKIAHMLCVANVPSYFVSPGDAAHGAFGAVQAGDVLIVLSKGGNTEELVNLIASIKGKGLTLVTVTQEPDSHLARAADIVLNLKVASRTTSICCNGEHTGHYSPYSTLCGRADQVSAFSEEAFYLNHNHGSVGALLKDTLENK